MCSREGLDAKARPAGVRSKKLFTTAAAKGSIMGTRTWSAVEAFFKLKRAVIKNELQQVPILT
jgi:hypothetical protein